MKIHTQRFSNTLAIIAPATLLVAGNTDAAFDGYLKIGDIKGEATATGHEDEIEILSWSWGVSRSTADGGGTGRPAFQEFTISKGVDKSSPKLFLACATGTHIPEIVLSATRPTPAGGETTYYTITLHDVLISSLQSDRPQPAADGTAAGRGVPTESLSLSFEKITWVYRPMDPATGQLGEPVSASVEVE